MMRNEQLLPLGSRNRPGTPLRSRTAVVLHWVANAGATAQQVADFIRGRHLTNTPIGSYNFLIGMDGTVINQIPVGEVTFNAGTSGRHARLPFPNNANEHTASIGLCHDRQGNYTDVQIARLKELLVELRAEGFWLLLTHFDVTGKLCDTYYRTNPQELEALAKECGYERP